MQARRGCLVATALWVASIVPAAGVEARHPTAPRATAWTHTAHHDAHAHTHGAPSWAPSSPSETQSSTSASTVLCTLATREDLALAVLRQAGTIVAVVSGHLRAEQADELAAAAAVAATLDVRVCAVVCDVDSSSTSVYSTQGESSRTETVHGPSSVPPPVAEHPHGGHEPFVSDADLCADLVGTRTHIPRERDHDDSHHTHGAHNMDHDHDHSHPRHAHASRFYEASGGWLAVTGWTEDLVRLDMVRLSLDHAGDDDGDDDDGNDDGGGPTARMLVTGGALLEFARRLVAPPVMPLAHDAAAIAAWTRPIVSASGVAAVRVRCREATRRQQGHDDDANTDSDTLLQHAGDSDHDVNVDGDEDTDGAFEAVASRRDVPRIQFGSVVVTTTTTRTGRDVRDGMQWGGVLVMSCTTASDVAACLTVASTQTGDDNVDEDGGEEARRRPPCCEWFLPERTLAQQSADQLRQWLTARQRPPLFRLTINSYNAVRHDRIPMAILYLNDCHANDDTVTQTLARFRTLAQTHSFSVPDKCATCWVRTPPRTKADPDCVTSHCERRLMFAWAMSNNKGTSTVDMTCDTSLEVWDHAQCRWYVFEGNVTSTDAVTVSALSLFLRQIVAGDLPPAFECTSPQRLGSPVSPSNRRLVHTMSTRRSVSPLSTTPTPAAASTAVRVHPMWRPPLPDSVHVAVVGAGPAGVGVAVALQAAGVDKVVLLERGRAPGASFSEWSPDMHMVTPSFYSNPSGTVDLNAVTPHSSPAFTEGVEHVSGTDFASYLHKVSVTHGLEVLTDTTVDAITLDAVSHQWPDVRGFNITTSRGSLFARYVVWAAGEQAHPVLPSIVGAELGQHVMSLANWSALLGRPYRGSYRHPVVIVGGGDSGAQLAAWLLLRGCPRVTLCDGDAPWDADPHEPGALSPSILSALRRANASTSTRGNQRLVTVPHHAVSVNHTAGKGSLYTVTTAHGQTYTTRLRPLLATGFTVMAPPMAPHFSWHAGSPVLNGVDESTVASGMWFAGPRRTGTGALAREAIYQFRVRFPTIALSIAERLGVSRVDATRRLAHYAQHNFHDATAPWDPLWPVADHDDDNDDVDEPWWSEEHGHDHDHDTHRHGHNHYH
eukprot:m.198681 g.198681  ORF g.198681 m.198681 type:complete len:1114 (+) comp20512_c0_seq1:17-3358(+)